MSISYISICICICIYVYPLETLLKGLLTSNAGGASSVLPAPLSYSLYSLKGGYIGV